MIVWVWRRKSCSRYVSALWICYTICLTFLFYTLQHLREYLDAEHRNKKKAPFDFSNWQDYAPDVSQPTLPLFLSFLRFRFSPISFSPLLDQKIGPNTTARKRLRLWRLHMPILGKRFKRWRNIPFYAERYAVPPTTDDLGNWPYETARWLNFFFFPLTLERWPLILYLFRFVFLFLFCVGSCVCISPPFRWCTLL